MTRKPSKADSLKVWISFVAGHGFLARIIFYDPTAVPPHITALIAVLIFGPGIITLWRQGKKGADDE